MSRAAVIGEASLVQGYALAGALVYPAEDRHAAKRAWRALPADVAVVILTERAAAWVGEIPEPRPGLLPVVMRA
jgi:vacuolar-type H+-ATPase subunit F/Vma7